MKFCSSCGGKITMLIPEGDNRERHVCDSCNTIHYQNPRIIAGTLPVYEDKVLLCRRAIEPRYGFWTLPAGFMENGETTQEAAERETWEEAEAKIDIAGLYTLYDLPHINQVYMFYRGTVIDGKFGPGQESLETQLFAESEIPWGELAFPTIGRTLKRYFDDRKSGDFEVHIEEIKTSWKKPKE
ncbi:NUDIX hydrolase [Gammaproteobacteria bacterium 45_16_T64]|nr:NUDIX hydrolase [Gammaproteobacteria bacterium 45_16_T64]